MQALGNHLLSIDMEFGELLFDSSNHAAADLYTMCANRGCVVFKVDLTTRDPIAAFTSNIPSVPSEVVDNAAALFCGERIYPVRAGSAKALIVEPPTHAPKWGSQSLDLGVISKGPAPAWSGAVSFNSIEKGTYPGWPGCGGTINVRRVAVYSVVKRRPYALAAPAGSCLRFAVHPAAARWFLREQPIDKHSGYLATDINGQHVNIVWVDGRGFALVITRQGAAGWAKVDHFAPRLPIVMRPLAGYTRATVRTTYDNVRPRAHPREGANKLSSNLKNRVVDVICTSPPFSLCVCDEQAMGWVKTEYLEPLAAEEEPSPIETDATLAFNRCETFDEDDAFCPGTPPPPKVDNALAIVHALTQNARKKDWKEVISVLETCPASVNIPLGQTTFRSRQTLLHRAALTGDKSLVSNLLAFGADRAVLSVDGFRPLDVAQAQHPHDSALHAMLVPDDLTVSVLLRREGGGTISGIELLRVAALFSDVVVPFEPRQALDVLQRLRGVVREMYGGDDSHWNAFLSHVQQSLRVTYTHLGLSRQFAVVGDLFPKGSYFRNAFALLPMASTQSALDGLLTACSVSPEVREYVRGQYEAFLKEETFTTLQREFRKRIETDSAHVPVPSPMPTPAPVPVVRWLAIGDWGEDIPPLATLAAGMAIWANEHPLDFVLLLGDNFYPSGVSSIRDPRFKRMWMDKFLIHPSLCVPYKVILGNHDIKGDWNAQVDFTNSPDNPMGLWQARGLAGTRCGRYYSFDAGTFTSYDIQPKDTVASIARAHNVRPGKLREANALLPLPPTDDAAIPTSIRMFSIPPAKPLATFVGIDTSATQYDFLPNDPKLHERFRERVLPFLRTALEESTESSWRIAFGHHPMYTQGSGHGEEARRLRSTVYKTTSGVEKKDGWGLEDLATRGNLDMYIAGHDHTMQIHRTKATVHCVVGAALESSFWRGQDKAEPMEWVGLKTVGFMAFEATAERIVIRVIDCRSGAVVREIVKSKK